MNLTLIQQARTYNAHTEPAEMNLYPAERKS